MIGMDTTSESCPFAFNFNPDTFQPGDIVSYRVTGSMTDMPFVGVILSVHEDRIIIQHGEDPDADGTPMPATRQPRPIVAEADALA